MTDSKYYLKKLFITTTTNTATATAATVAVQAVDTLSHQSLC